ncbi:IclR family transcriptional regulator [Novosphingobium sp. G106]|uniref:IclR family transcriptional regulator n=1 Tax=Novosphingobium sp. G106 TaxID=2849500 RepID=UPI001C2D6A2E|nr:IclR family transcriptional regulator [Novosphingobium sp. G106]MBV1688948.1 IclR family transcriptional regulator [Novosphingobium sp. G106]
MLRLFEVLSGEPDGLTLSEIGQQLNEAKSTVHNTLRALEADGFLTLDGLSYQLGPKAFRLATHISSGWSLLRSMRSYLRELADRSQETAMLSVIDRTEHRFMHVDAIEGSQRIRYVYSLGSGGPLYATASGRVLLAFQPREYQEDYLEALDMRPFTPATTVDKDIFRQQLDEVRDTRLWVSLGEIYGDGGAIAAPVFGPNGDVIAALSVALPLSRLVARKQELMTIVGEVARRASGDVREPMLIKENG